MNSRFAVSLISLILVPFSFLAWADGRQEIDKLAVECRTERGKSCDKLTRAVEKLSDQAALADIATLFFDSATRNLALRKVTDQTLLAGIAEKSPFAEVRQAAAENLTDQAVLATFAKSPTRRSDGVATRRSAAAKVTDQALVADMVETAQYDTVREAAAENLTDQAVLAELAKSATRWPDGSALRARAVAKITNQTLLAGVAKAALYGDVLQAAIANLTDQAVLVEIAQTARQCEFRESAAKRITSPAVLPKIAWLRPSGGLRLWISDKPGCSPGYGFSKDVPEVPVWEGTHHVELQYGDAPGVGVPYTYTTKGGCCYQIDPNLSTEGGHRLWSPTFKLVACTIPQGGR